MNMNMQSLVVERVIAALSKVHEKHAECSYAVLNDVALVVYGLVKPLEEVRLIIDESCAEEVVQALLSEFDVEAYLAETTSRLKAQGLAAISTRFYPLLVVELASTSLDRELVKNSIEVHVEGSKLKVPKLEYLIAKLASMKLYPYLEYALALLVAWILRLDVDSLVSLLRSTGVDIDVIINRLKLVCSLLGAFDRFSREAELLKSLITRMRAGQVL